MSVLYTTQFPPDLNDDADIKLHESRVAKGPEATGLALKGGTVLRYVEFSPGYTVRLDHTPPEAPEPSPFQPISQGKKHLLLLHCPKTAPSLTSSTCSA